MMEDMYDEAPDSGEAEDYSRVSDKDLDQIIREISEALAKEEEERAEEDAIIFGRIMSTLDRRGCIFTCDLNRKDTLVMECDEGNKPFRMLVSVSGGDIRLRALFPFRVQQNSLAIVALYTAELNQKHAYPVMNLDYRTGELSLDHSYTVEKEEDYRENAFYSYFRIMKVFAMEHYARLMHLAAGKVPGEIIDRYKTSVELAALLLKGIEDERRIRFGSDTEKKRTIKRRTKRPHPTPFVRPGKGTGPAVEE